MSCTDSFSLATAANTCLSSFEKHSSVCMESGANAFLDVLDFDAYDEVRSSHFTGSKDLAEFFRDGVPSVNTVRVFFICQRDSWSSLNITKEMINSIISHHSIMPQIYDLLRCFRYRSEQTEDAFCCPIRTRRTSKTSEICYSYRYSDLKKTVHGESWAIRQSGVYHQYDKENNRSTWIIISPMHSSPIENVLRNSIQDLSARSEIARNHMLLHPMLLSTCLSNWRYYFEPIDYELRNIYKQIATTVLNEPLSLNDKTLRRAHHLAQELQPLQANFKSFQKILTHLQEFNIDNFYVNAKKNDIVDSLSSFAVDVSVYKENAEYLVQRARTIAKQISHTLSLKNQSIAQEQSDNVFKLTKSTVDDSVTVRVITLVTLFYLPFSFIATIMGMNFFVQDPETHHIIVSPQFWIYFCISIPLTMITIFFWKWYARAGFKTKRDAEKASMSEKSVSDMV